jgi:alkanesulfonate monooxygenase SsuD/methylene tetrahydromethanopterin reductase-like flavin-dependent oxidoreductase (luciferase family)
MIERWRYLEALGFDLVWLADHFVNPNDPAQPWFEGWTLLGALAAQTNRIRVGTLTTNASLRHPAMLARQALTVDHVSGGRLDLGIGAGGAPLDHSMLGGEVWTPSERVHRFGEVVELVDRLLRDGLADFGGRYYQAREARMQPRPIQQPRPPLTLAAHGPATLKVAARYADTWNMSGTLGRGRRAGLRFSAEQMLDEIRLRSDVLDEHALRFGRDPATIRRAFVFVAGTTDDDPWASPAAFQDFVGRYRQVGISEFIFHWPRDGVTTAIEQIAAGVLPSLRLEARR